MDLNQLRCKPIMLASVGFKPMGLQWTNLLVHTVKCVKFNQKELTKVHIFMVFSHLEAASRTALCSNDVSVTQSLKIQLSQSHLFDEKILFGQQCDFYQEFQSFYTLKNQFPLSLTFLISFQEQKTLRCICSLIYNVNSVGFFFIFSTMLIDYHQI